MGAAGTGTRGDGRKCPSRGLTVLDALVTQYMVSDHAPEAIMITEQVNADGLIVKIEEQKLNTPK